ncbi:MAG: MATE family efflux transporter [Leptolyngbyaceae cyanobacterium SL_7_1]|nr:MATE family efflux transporter [Leptolyngbyaceae cyanobacterium SL_7_1]
MVTKPVRRSAIALESSEFLKLAVPLASAQVAQTAVGLVDSIMMGRLGVESLAAGGLAATAFQLLLNIASGVVMAVSPLVAEAQGAGRREQIEPIARQGLWLSLLLGIPLMGVIWHLDTGLLMVRQPEAIASLASDYFHFIAWGVVPALGFAMLRGYVSALSQAHMVIMIVAIGTLFNVGGNYVLGFGKFGFPRMELAGIGLASGLSFWLMFLLFLIYVLQHPQLREHQFLRDFYRIKFQLIGRLMAIGGAIAVTIALEHGLFAVITFLMGILGTEILAAHQTVSQTAYLIFMVPLGMSYAVTARVGHWFGRHDLRAAKQAGYVGIVVAAGFMVLMTIGLIVYRQSVVGIYLDVQNPTNAPVLALAIPMLIVAAVAQLLDGVQRVAMGALYGLQDTRIPMMLSGVAFWGVGLTAGYSLGFWLGLEGVGLWMGQSLGVAVAGVIFVWRFHRLTTCRD